MKKLITENLVIFSLPIWLGLLLTGCEPLPQEQRPTVTITEFERGKIHTVRHDDHSFVVATFSDSSGVSISIIHHPACPIEARKE